MLIKFLERSCRSKASKTGMYDSRDLYLAYRNVFAPTQTSLTLTNHPIYDSCVHNRHENEYWQLKNLNDIYTYNSLQTNIQQKHQRKMTSTHVLKTNTRHTIMGYYLYNNVGEIYV